MSVDLEKLAKQVDEALVKETPESLTKWLNERRQNAKTGEKQCNLPVVSSSISFETFRKLSSYDISNIKKDEPSSFNGNIEFRKYKITVEPIDESFEILSARLQTMWDKCDNYHHWNPLKAAAKSIGYELQGSAGSKRS